MVLSPSPPPPTPTPRLKILCCFMFLCTCAKKNPNYVEGVGSCWINLSVVQSLKWSNLFMTLIKRVFSQLMLIIVSCCVSCQILSWKSCWVIFFICKRQMQSNADKGLFILYIIDFKECSNHAQIRHAWLSQIQCRPEKNVKTLVPLPTYSYDPRGFCKGFFHKSDASEMPAKE